jgi:hypothetical protein
MTCPPRFSILHNNKQLKLEKKEAVEYLSASFCGNQCSGSRRIHQLLGLLDPELFLRIRILLSTIKNIEKNLISTVL